ncbi:hypothetical protein BpHYR1_021132 [Brachionus plicatilis]|uniref:Uncharacterized protein n=1 Tax=Brachionus plicatilis TaxID=10195 RepID=A0A3M7QXK1_BRAPC|nr:hypothetical protein BpHYR1_021132 [Brachionus plicatilis]
MLFFLDQLSSFRCSKIVAFEDKIVEIVEAFREPCGTPCGTPVLINGCHFFKIRYIKYYSFFFCSLYGGSLYVGSTILNALKNTIYKNFNEYAIVFLLNVTIKGILRFKSNQCQIKQRIKNYYDHSRFQKSNVFKRSKFKIETK